MLPASDVSATLESDPGAIALLPLDAVDASVRSLAVDDINIVFGTGDLASYPLAERVYVNQAGVSDALRQQLDQLGTELDARLGAPLPDPIVLRATGDILPVRCTYARIMALGGDFRLPFLALGPWLAEADITVGSLDASMSDAGTPFGCQETFSLMAPAPAVEGLAYSGFDVITVATNHVKDCGQAACGDQAFFETLSNIQSRGIQTVGGGADLTQARAPAFVMAKGIRFAFLGYDEIAPYYHAEPGIPGTAPLNDTYLREDIAAALQQADVVIVQPQWGIEYQAEPTETQQALAAAAVEAGATLIIGNHPHWVEAGQALGTSFVAYALGNFIFDQDWSLETQQGVMLEAVFHGKDLKGIRYHPVHIWDEHQPDFAEPAEAQQIMDRIWNASATLP
jgi:poly-gamma-glutamate synthesis protein (capsule biosynthesis protein)